MGFKKAIPRSTPISRALCVLGTHQHIDDHAVLHSDSLHKELSGPILWLIPEDIQVFIVVPFRWQQFWFLIIGTRLRRHQRWEVKDHDLRSKKDLTDNLIPLPHFTDEDTEVRRSKMSKVLQQVRGLGSLDSCSSDPPSYLTAFVTEHWNLSRICSLGLKISSLSPCQE